jgi:hypothetical protein
MNYPQDEVYHHDEASQQQGGAAVIEKQQDKHATITPDQQTRENSMGKRISYV